MTKNKTSRACMVCKKVVPIAEGVPLLRGITFMCKGCYDKKKEKEKDNESESCEFC